MILAGALLLAPSLARSEWPIATHYPWGLSYQDLKSRVSGLVRTRDGLTRDQWRYIARFCKDLRLNNEAVRACFAFKSNQLYEVEYNFKTPKAALYPELVDEFSRRLGPPRSRKIGARPEAPPLEKRQIEDTVWLDEKSLINLHSSVNNFEGGPSIRSLFLTFRENAPDEEIFVSVGDKSSPSRSLGEVTVAFTAPFGLGKRIKKAAKKAGTPRSWDYPFHNIAKLLNGVDFAVGDLETCLSKMPQDAWTAGLKLAGFDMVMLTHPEVLAEGPKHYERTVDMLAKADISMMGPLNRTRGSRIPFEVEIGGLNFGFFAYNVDGGKSSFNPLLEGIQREIKKFKKEKGGIVVVSLFWEAPDSFCPTGQQQSLARSAIDAGATLIVGHEPDGPSITEWYKSGMILYSSGHLLPDGLKKNPKVDSILFLATFTKDGLMGYDLLPLHAAATGRQAYQAIEARGKAAREIQEKLHKARTDCR